MNILPHKRLLESLVSSRSSRLSVRYLSLHKGTEPWTKPRRLSARPAPADRSCHRHLVADHDGRWKPHLPALCCRLLYRIGMAASVTGYLVLIGLIYVAGFGNGALPSEFRLRSHGKLRTCSCWWPSWNSFFLWLVMDGLFGRFWSDHGAVRKRGDLGNNAFREFFRRPASCRWMKEGLDCLFADYQFSFAARGIPAKRQAARLLGCRLI